VDTPAFRGASKSDHIACSTQLWGFNMPAENIEPLEAEHGQKMIEIKLRFLDQ
jgi:hypothetical protein